MGETVERFGRIDILINNAGILKLGRIDEYPLHDFEQMALINVRAIFVAVKAAIGHMGEGEDHNDRERYGRSCRLPRIIGLQHDKSCRGEVNAGHGP